MFVRNNTTCPNCGKSKTFDVTMPEWTTPAYLTITAECRECMWVGWSMIHAEVARDFCLAATKLLPRSSVLRRAWRWTPGPLTTGRKRIALHKLIWELLEPSRVDVRFLNGRAHAILCGEVISIIGDLICHITFTSSLSQPLAS
jgi:hypothetical protein